MRWGLLRPGGKKRETRKKTDLSDVHCASRRHIANSPGLLHSIDGGSAVASGAGSRGHQVEEL